MPENECHPVSSAEYFVSLLEVYDEVWRIFLILSLVNLSFMAHCLPVY